MVKFDFASIKERLLENLSAKSEWSEFLEFGPNVLLIDSIAQEMAYQMQYDEYLTFENWWQRARNKSSLLVESPMLGYKVPRKRGSIGTLRVSTHKDFTGTYINRISLPKYFQFSNGTLYFCIYEEYKNLEPSDQYIDFQVTQGEAKRVDFVAVGDLFETKVVQDAGLDDQYFDLYVNNIKWTVADSLFEYAATDKVYEIVVATDLNSFTLKFGNNIFGQKLNIGDSVSFRYVSTLGVEGNLYNLNAVNVVEDQAVDVLGNAVDLYVKNITPCLNGRDYPTSEEIRIAAPRTYQSGDRATSKQDYDVLISAFPFISKVGVWGAYEYLVDNGLDIWTFVPTEENVVHIAALNSTYDNLSDTEKRDIILRLHEVNDPTDLLQFEDVELITIYFVVNATVINSSYDLTTVRDDIINLLVATYGIANTEFSQNIYLSDYISLVDTVTGVRNNDTYVDIIQRNGFSVPYIVSTNYNLYPIDFESMRIYIDTLDEFDVNIVEDSFLLATVDQDGQLISTDPGTYSTAGSIINLETGAATIVVNTGLSLDISRYIIRTVFRPVSSNLLLTKRSHIFAYENSSVTVNYPS